MPEYSVPIIIETTELWTVDAKHGYEAAMKVGAMRDRWQRAVHEGTQPDAGDKPALVQQTNFKMGKARETVLDPTKIAGGAEHTDASTKPDKGSARAQV